MSETSALWAEQSSAFHNIRYAHGDFDRPHELTVDQDGNLYVAIRSSQKVGIEKYVPRAGVDRKRLIVAGINR